MAIRENNPGKQDGEITVDIDRYYMDIINALPDIVYWVDIECKLQGCNNNFVRLLGLKKVRDLVGTPYEQMMKFCDWSDERINAFKFDDMQVIFSAEPHYNIEEAPFIDGQGKASFYRSTRVPLYNSHKQVIGLVVVLTEMPAGQESKMHSLPSSQSAVKPATLDLQKATSSPHVLMIEDNFVTQKIEEALLISLNCEVDIAESGDRAISLFKPGKYDIVFMDIGLEDTSGYMVAKKLRQLEKNTVHHVPIIALTVYQASIIKNDCYDYSMQGVITKPLTKEQAHQIIKRFVYQEEVAVDGLELGAPSEPG